MEKLLDFVNRFFVTSVCIAVVIVTAAIPTFAYRVPDPDIYPDKVIDGHTFSPIILESSDFQNMFFNGHIDLTCNVTSNQHISITDLVNRTNLNSYFSFSLPSEELPSTLSAVNLLNECIVEYPIVIYGDGGNLQTTYNIDLPFSYMLLGGEIELRIFQPITSVNASSLSLVVNTPYDTSYQYITDNFTIFTGNWTESNMYVSNLVVGYNYTTTRPYALMSYELRPSILHTVHSLNISVSTTGSRTSATSPVGIVFCEWVVYINSDGWTDPDAPTYEDLVMNYLDSIVNITPDNQARVDELREKLSDLDSTLDDLSNDMNVEIPDVDNLIDDIDDDIIDGSTQFSESIMSPILNSNVMIILFGGLFVVAAMKLTLFGSGKS